MTRTQTLIGFDIELLNALQKKLGFTIADNTIQAMSYSALTTSVAEVSWIWRPRTLRHGRAEKGHRLLQGL
jgi:hypothetical protein